MKISKNAMGNIVAEAAELMNIFLVDCQEFRATINAIIDYCQSGKLPATSARIKPAFWEFLKAKIDKIAERAECARLRKEQKQAASRESSESSECSEKSDQPGKVVPAPKPQTGKPAGELAAPLGSRPVLPELSAKEVLESIGKNHYICCHG